MVSLKDKWFSEHKIINQPEVFRQKRSPFGDIVNKPLGDTSTPISSFLSPIVQAAAATLGSKTSRPNNATPTPLQTLVNTPQPDIPVTTVTPPQPQTGVTELVNPYAVSPRRPLNPQRDGSAFLPGVSANYEHRLTDLYNNERFDDVSYWEQRGIMENLFERFSTINIRKQKNDYQKWKNLAETYLNKHKPSDFAFDEIRAYNEHNGVLLENPLQVFRHLSDAIKAEAEKKEGAQTALANSLAGIKPNADIPQNKQLTNKQVDQAYTQEAERRQMQTMTNVPVEQCTLSNTTQALEANPSNIAVMEETTKNPITDYVGPVDENLSETRSIPSTPREMAEHVNNVLKHFFYIVEQFKNSAEKSQLDDDTYIQYKSTGETLISSARGYISRLPTYGFSPDTQSQYYEVLSEAIRQIEECMRPLRDPFEPINQESIKVEPSPIQVERKPNEEAAPQPPNDIVSNSIDSTLTPPPKEDNTHVVEEEENKGKSFYDFIPSVPQVIKDQIPWGTPKKTYPQKSLAQDFELLAYYATFLGNLTGGVTTSIWENVKNLYNSLPEREKFTNAIRPYMGQSERKDNLNMTLDDFRSYYKKFEEIVQDFKKEYNNYIALKTNSPTPLTSEETGVGSDLTLFEQLQKTSSEVAKLIEKQVLIAADRRTFKTEEQRNEFIFKNIEKIKKGEQNDLVVTKQNDPEFGIFDLSKEVDAESDDNTKEKVRTLMNKLPEIVSQKIEEHGDDLGYLGYLYRVLEYYNYYGQVILNVPAAFFVGAYMTAKRHVGFGLKIRKKRHPVNELYAHLNSLPKQEDKDFSFQKIQGCGFCGGNRALRVHHRDLTDLTCHNCLVAHGQSSKRYTSRTTRFQPIEISEHAEHKKVHDGHKRNELLLELHKQNKPNLMEEFNDVSYSPRFLRQHQKDYVMMRDEHLPSDVDRLTYLIGLSEHAPENMNANLKANMHALAINHMMNRKAGSHNRIPFKSLLKFSTLKKELEEHPHSVMSIL